MTRIAVTAFALCALCACAPTISSQGQSGGVTAGSVGTINQYNFAPERRVRHVTNIDKTNLHRVFGPLVSMFPALDIKAPGDGEAQGYAAEFMDTFNGIGIKVERVGFIIPTGAGSLGLGVIVRDLNHPPPDAERFAEAMVAAGFQVKGGVDAGLAPDKFYFVVGSAP